MLDTYLILNRKQNYLIKIFLINVIILLLITIYGINTLYYEFYIQLHSEILSNDSSFYLKVFVPEKEVLTVTEGKIIEISSKKYTYTIDQIEDNILYKDNENYQIFHLKIDNLDPIYKKNGYHIKVKIKKDRRKFIDYLKE